MAAGGKSTAFFAFAVAATTIVILLAALSLIIGTAQLRLAAALRGSAQQVKRWGGIVLIFVGSWLLMLAIWADDLIQFLN